uniref:Uncharacterized protein n=1 Tax=Globodera rostochiensis TaxID=31243 RepID=A0A914I9P1_GLORO
MATHRQRPRPTVMPNWHAVTRHRTPTANAILSSVVLLLIIMPQDALPNESATNLRVFRQQISPDRPEQNMNIGIIQVKLKNWSSTTVLPSARQTPPALPPGLTTRTRRAWPTTEVSETIVGTEQPHQHRRRWNNNVLDGGRGQQQQKRTAQLKDAVPTRGSGGSSSGSGGGWSIDMGQDMDGLFPYLLLALGLALVAFFIILYAILNALLQRKEAQQNEEEMAGQRRRRRTRRSRRQRRGAREAEAEQDEEWMDTEDEEEADEALERERDEEEERNRGFTVLDEDELYPRHSKWGRKKQRSRAGHESPEGDQADEIHRSRRYRSARRAQNGFAPEPPHPPLPRGRPPPRPRHVEWKDGAGGAEDTALFHDVPFPPPPPPRVPPPPPPLPSRYQRRRSRASATSDPSVSLTSASHHRAHRSPHRPSRAHPPPPPLLPADEFSDVDTESVQSGGRGSAGQRRQRTTTTAAARTNHRQQRPPLPLRRENTDSTVSSVQRGRAGSL